MKIIKNTLFSTLLLLFAYFIYANGFSGGFIFDDASNLYNLKVFNAGKDFNAFVNYLLSNHAGNMKRPISTMSFLLNATNWPADPYFFKVTNFIIHVLNGCLLFLATKKILFIAGMKQRFIINVSLLSSLIWFFHPFFVSTVFYIVQRMSMLPVTFVLLGIILYCKGRILLATNSKKSYIYIFISVFVFTSLATLSKENGVLLPLFLLILEQTIIKNSNLTKLNSKIKTIVLILPIAVIVAALIYKTPVFFESYQLREFTLAERLFSQSRILVIYLSHLFIPEYFTEGVFGDGIQKSKGLISPITTLYSIILIAVLLGIAFIKRNRNPLLSFSLLFFFSAHILESSFIPLELYFEHRNYLPAVFLFLPLSVFLINLSQKRNIFYILPVVLILFLSLNTFLRTSLWGNNLSLHVETAKKYPESIRASTIAASKLAQLGMVESSINMLEKAVKNHSSLELEANLLNLKCRNKTISKVDFDHFLNSMKKTKFTLSDTLPFNNFVSTLIQSKCSEIGLDYTYKFLTEMKNNKGYELIITKNYNQHNLAKYYASIEKYDLSLEETKNFINETTRLPIFVMTLEVIDILIEKKQYDKIIEILDSLQPMFDSDIYDKDVYLHKPKYKLLYIKINELKVSDAKN